MAPLSILLEALGLGEKYNTQAGLLPCYLAGAAELFEGWR
jgi:hypothetical protein